MVLRYLFVLLSLLTAYSQITCASTLQINRFAMATSIVNHEPVNIKEAFKVEDRTIAAFVEFIDTFPENITFCWFYNDHLYSQWKTHIPASPRFRTYSQVTAHPGHWNIKIVDSKDKIIKEQAFVVSTPVLESNREDKVSQIPYAVPSKKTRTKKTTTERPTSVREALRSLQPKKSDKQ